MNTICVIGAGYVGIPLAMALARTDAIVFNYDINKSVVDDLRNGIDPTGQFNQSDISRDNYRPTDDPNCLPECDYIIVTVPTPITNDNTPDLFALGDVCRLIGQHIITTDVTIVIESTVYPGVIEDLCIPAISQHSSISPKYLKVGYSPERINPGDNENTLYSATKIVAGNSKDCEASMLKLYKTICPHVVVSTIKEAELTKVFENTQRDVNIALMNELALCCDMSNIRTNKILSLLKTKWNSLPFHPGMVGGHCIGVDSLYYRHYTKQLGLFSLVEKARTINDFIPSLIVNKLLSLIDKNPRELKVLVLGLAFKPNVRDDRTSKSYEVIELLDNFGFEVSSYDPLVNPKPCAPDGVFDVVVLATPHDVFTDSFLWDVLSDTDGILMDVYAARSQPPFISKYWSL